jgi:hypothetical protein
LVRAAAVGEVERRRGNHADARPHDPFKSAALSASMQRPAATTWSTAAKKEGAA